jgi:peptide/nickel transport system ATP-binding protein
MSAERHPRRERASDVPSGAVLTVSDLRVVLTGTEIDVVDDVSFSLAPAEILGLVGESGSGKTTVALALLGYARRGTSIAGGSVNVNGLEVLSLKPARLREVRGKVVSYVPQDPTVWLNPSLRIGRQLLEALEEHDVCSNASERTQRVEEILEEVNLPSDASFRARYPHQLSGGQQQRVVIAMAFACRPDVVVLDEPTTGLDVSTQAHVLNTVRSLAEHHRTAALYVSHDLAVVASLANHIAVMYSGRIIERGPADEVVHRAAHPYSRRLLAAAPDAHQRRALVGIPGRVAPLGTVVTGCRFADRCDFAEDPCRANDIVEERLPEARPHVVRCRRWQTLRAAPPVSTGEMAVGADAADGSPPFVEVKGLSAWYGKNQVLSDVNLSLNKGKCLALVGESGSGKTTLSWCLGGLHREGSGSLVLDGEPLEWGTRRRSDETRRAVQYIFQNPFSSLNPRKTIGAIIEQPSRHFGLPIDGAASELLEQVSLPASYARRYPAQLSGGERQRVAIARALAVSPTLLICDEITSALDVSVQASIVALLARLHEETSLTVLFVTHNLALVRAIADRVAVLEQGVIVEDGSVDQVLDAPRHPYTQSLLRNTPSIEEPSAASGN